MAFHVVVGAGPVGTAIAADLLARGETVRVITRSGTGLEGAERVAADASDAARMVELTTGAKVIYNCVNPPYDKWVEMWPPIAAALLQAAAASGAVLAIVDNLYAYGPVDGPMSPAVPDRPSSVKGGVRKQMWEDALAAARSGRITATVAVRGSDYVGNGPSVLSMMVMPRARKGKSALVPADLDVAHTWTNPSDAGRLLVKAALDPAGWNRYWLVPSPAACSVRELANRAAELEGLPAPKVRAMPLWLLRLGGMFNSLARGFVEMNYQFRRPFLLDTRETEAVFGSEFTSLDESIRQNLGLKVANPAKPAQHAPIEG
jgi:nucleoside-diphosphate-sugar epimerase